MYKVFIDGREGTTGLRIDAMLAGRKDIEIIPIADSLRKDEGERARLMAMADVVFLCLPDQAAREAAALAGSTRVIDASTAHRTSDAWAYGLPELSKEHRQAIKDASRVSNPGCHATGFITLVYPLVKLGIMPEDALLTCHSITGYTGGGKKMIAQYEAEERPRSYLSPRQYALGLSHKHIPEMTVRTGLNNAPVFNPVVADFPRGMATTVPIHLSQLKAGMTIDSLRQAYGEYYQGERFIHVMEKEPEDGCLEANAVVDSNDLEIFVLGGEERAILVSRFDNLGKGASGAAVQNMNIMLGLDEAAGL